MIMVSTTFLTDKNRKRIEVDKYKGTPILKCKRLDGTLPSYKLIDGDRPAVHLYRNCEGLNYMAPPTGRLIVPFENFLVRQLASGEFEEIVGNPQSDFIHSILWALNFKPCYLCWQTECREFELKEYNANQLNMEYQMSMYEKSITPLSKPPKPQIKLTDTQTTLINSPHLKGSQDVRIQSSHLNLLFLALFFIIAALAFLFM